MTPFEMEWISMPALATSEPTALRMSDKRNPYITSSQQRESREVEGPFLTAPATPITDAMIPNTVSMWTNRMKRLEVPISAIVTYVKTQWRSLRFPHVPLKGQM